MSITNFSFADLLTRAKELPCYFYEVGRYLGRAEVFQCNVGYRDYDFESVRITCSKSLQGSREWDSFPVVNATVHKKPKISGENDFGGNLQTFFTLFWRLFAEI